MSEQPATPAGAPQWDVADRMRKALRHANVEVQEIAVYLGVSRTSVSNWINGRIDPSTQTLRLVALRCGVPYEWLATGEEEPRPGGPGTASPQADPQVSYRGSSPLFKATVSPLSQWRSRIPAAARVTPLTRPVAA